MRRNGICPAADKVQTVLGDTPNSAAADRSSTSILSIIFFGVLSILHLSLFEFVCKSQFMAESQSQYRPCSAFQPLVAVQSRLNDRRDKRRAPFSPASIPVHILLLT
jgi:hypothetical protein